jgi:hypothetical protein
MPAHEKSASQSGTPALLRDPDWTAAKLKLEAIRRDLLTQIRNYPAPIPACDVHFNTLLEQRNLVSEALQELEALPSRYREASQFRKALEAFQARLKGLG